MPSKSRTAQFRRVLQAAQKRYGRSYGVLGIGVGTKLVLGRPTDNHEAVQFYVQRKGSRELRKFKRLPRYLFCRNARGRAIRSERVMTDVIAVGKVTPACLSGDIVRSLNDKGAITLLFKNKDPKDRGRYLMTCSHVASRMDRKVPVPNWVKVDCEPTPAIFGHTIASSFPNRGILEFDVAIAQLGDDVPAQPNCSVGADPPIRLTELLAHTDLRLPLEVECALPASKIQRAQILSFLGSVAVTYPVGEVMVKNAFLLNASVMPGDSGGLLFIDDVAVGLVFARSDSNWGWCHILSDAFAYLSKFANKNLLPF